MRKTTCFAIIAIAMLATACGQHRMSSRQRAAKSDSIALLIKQGKELREHSDFMNAIARHEQAVQMATDIGDTLQLITAYNDLATDMRRIGMLNEAMSYHYEALSRAEAMEGDTTFARRKGTLKALNGIGNIQLTLGDYVNADSTFRRALEGERDLNSNLGMAINYANLGSIKEHLGQRDSARHFYELSLHHNVLAKSDLGVALCHTHFGRLAEHAHDYATAMQEYRITYDTLLTSKDRWHWLESVLSLARVSLKTGDLPSAEHYLQQASTTAKRINSREHQADIYQLLSEYFELQGDTRRALAYHKRFSELSDSIVNAKNVDKMQTLHLNYAKHRSRKDYEQMRQTYEAQQKEKYFIIGTTATMLVLAITGIVILVYAQRMRLKRNQSVRELEKMRSTFLTNITHEFRTPITIITGLAKQLRLGKVAAEEMPQTLGTIERQSDTLLKLISQLLDTSRLTAGTSAADERWVHGNIAAYMAMAMESYRQYAGMKKVLLTFDRQSGSIEMDFVEQYISNILSNLIGNALKFTPEGGEITVALSSSEQQMMLTVDDTGCGFAEEDLPYVFNMFYQGTNGHQQSGQGTGVGLGYVNQMTERMNGQIKAENNTQGGARITLSLPLTHKGIKAEPWNAQATIAAQQTAQESSPLAEPEPHENEEKETVLIVDDNADIRHYLCSLLREKYNLMTASDGIDALAKMQTNVPDLVLSDLMMPNMDGYEMCRRIRNTDDLNHLPVVIITAKTQDEDRLKSLSAGADAYLQKPFSTEELYVRIEHLLEQRRILKEKFSRGMMEDSDDLMHMEQADRDFISDLAASVRQGINEKEFNSATLASNMCMSYSQLNRKLKNITGMTIGAYITQMRLEKARNLLMSTQMSIGDIAVNCGFDDSSYFSRTFKQTFGDTPTQYRSNILQQKS